jgi:hypothetical protein
MTSKQLEANRRNALRSTGPRTAEGKAWSRMNALKHGLLSRQIIVRSRQCPENTREFRELHRRLSEQLAPVGAVEELLVEQIVTSYWRLKRALVAESGEITLVKNRDHDEQSKPKDVKLLWMTLQMSNDPFTEMTASVAGITMLLAWLKDLRAQAAVSGDVTEADVRKFLITKEALPNRLSLGLDRLRTELRENPEGLNEEALRNRNRERIAQRIDLEVLRLENLNQDRADRDAAERHARQSAAMLPATPVLDRILRYETKLERQMQRAMVQLERLQRLRAGEAVPAPLCVEVTEKT